MAADCGKQDVIFLNDILHYLSVRKQTYAARPLCNGSIQSWRDTFHPGRITDNEEDNIKNTKTTEALSTGLFSFNRKSEEFHFFSSNDIQAVCRKARSQL
jgi:hypothetical protein